MELDKNLYLPQSADMPPWLSLSQLAWLDVTEPSNPTPVQDVTGNLSLHTDDAFAGSSTASGGGGGGTDLIKVDDIVTPFFELSKIIDVVVKEEDQGKTLTYLCQYENSHVTGREQKWVELYDHR